MAHGNTKHGYEKHAHYFRWRNMNSRCYNLKDIGYQDYGGRGITVCPEWSKEAGPKAFCDWAEETYIEGCWLDRENNDAGYSPENCRWLTPKDSAANRRDYKRAKNNLPVGVYPNGNRFMSVLQTNGEIRYLGSFSSPEEATEAFRKAREL